MGYLAIIAVFCLALICIFQAAIEQGELEDFLERAGQYHIDTDPQRGKKVMSYVIQRYGDGAFVAASPVTGCSYTRDLTKARIFPAKEAAQAECCGNENVVHIDKLIMDAM